MLVILSGSQETEHKGSQLKIRAHKMSPVFEKATNITEKYITASLTFSRFMIL